MKLVSMILYLVVDYEQSLSSVVRRAKRETRKWPRARLMARDGRGTKKADALVSRVSRLRRSRARALPLLNRKKKRESKLVAKLQYQAISWREMIETETEGVSPFISGILSIMNVYLISSAKASSGLAVR